MSRNLTPAPLLKERGGSTSISLFIRKVLKDMAFMNDVLFEPKCRDSLFLKSLIV